MGALELSGAFKSLLFGDGNYMEFSTKTETVCSVLPSVSILCRYVMSVRTFIATHVVSDLEHETLYQTQSKIKLAEAAL